MSSLPKISIQTESSDCGFAALATFLGAYSRGNPVNSIDLRNLYGEGPNGISLSGFVRLLDKLGIKYDIAEYSYGAISSNTGLYFAMELDGRSGHITLLASLNNRSVWRADLLTGRWSKISESYSATKYLVIVHNPTTALSRIVTSTSKDAITALPQQLSLRSAFSAITIFSLPGLLPWAAPFLALALGSRLAASSSFNAALPLISIFLVAFARLLTGWVGAISFAKFRMKLEHMVLSSLWQKPLNFFTQRSLWDVGTYILDASQVANLLTNTIKFEVGYTFALAVSILITLAYFPLTVSAVIIGFVVLVVFGSNLLYLFLEKMREEERLVSGMYSMHYMAGIINPIGAFYSKRNPAEAPAFISLSKRAASAKAKADTYENLIQSVRSSFVVGTAFGLAFLLSERLAANTNWAGHPQMLYPFIMSLSIVATMFSDARYQHSRETLAMERLRKLLTSGSREPIRQPGPRTQDEKAYRIAVAGKNGSGKSTFLKALSGLTLKDQTFAGAGLLAHPLIKELLGTLQKERDILYLNSTFIPLGATAHEALASADENFRSEKSFPKSFSKLSLDSVPHFFDRQVYSGFSSLSTGEAQRLAVLFSLVARPKVLILDETLSAIPQAERKDLLNYLNEELKGTTLIYVDHHNDIDSS